MKTPFIRWAIVFAILVLGQHYILKQWGWGPERLQNLEIDTVTAALSHSPKQTMTVTSDVQGDIVIPLRKNGGGWIISVELNGLYSANLILDTGATITSLSEDLAFDMGLTADPRYAPITAETANGSTTAWITHVQTIQTGEAELNNLQVAVLDFSNLSQRNINGLLGLNFLKKFDWQLDQEQKALILNSKS